MVRLEKRNRRASHIVLELKLGRPLSPGMQALHTCDNPPCCNPRHLFEGTQKTNVRDCIAKGRFPHGERHGNAITSEAIALRIKALLALGMSAPEVVAETGASVWVVYDIKQGKTWKHVGVGA